MQGAGTKEIWMLPPLAPDRPCTTLWGVVAQVEWSGGSHAVSTAC
jgi:hypothetical protein